MSEKELAQIPEQTSEQVSEDERKKELKKKLARTGVALFTSASVLVGGVFPSPDALLADEQPLNPVVAYENGNGNDLDGDGGRWRCGSSCWCPCGHWAGGSGR